MRSDRCVLGVAALLMVAAPAARCEAAQPTLPALEVKAVSKLVTRHGARVVRVGEVSVAGVAPRWDVRVGCPLCERDHQHLRKGWSGRTRRFMGVNWLLANRKATIIVTATAPGYVGRWAHVTRVAKRAKVTASGCLDAKRRHVDCSTATPSPSATKSPATGPDGDPSDSGAPATTPGTGRTPPSGSNPAGRLDSATRVGAKDVRLVGWSRDADAVSTPVLVKAVIDGVPTESGLANVPRLDVGAHGFDLIVPIDRKSHVVCALAMNVLGGSDVQLSGCTTVQPLGDFNRDGYVGCDDVRYFVSEFRKTGVTPADLNADGVVDSWDLNLLMSNWSPPPGETPCT